MKKLFIVTLAVLFFAGAAYAVEYDYSGMINTRGRYLENDSGLQGDKNTWPGDTADYMFYDMEFDSTLNIMPTDKSLIRLRFEVHDENFTTGPAPSSGDGASDDNIYFNRAWGKYTFDNGMSTSFGMMSGGAFGTAFGDNGDAYYRVRLDGAAGFGNWGFILEKLAENGTDAYGDNNTGAVDLKGWEAEKDDSDAYAAFLVTKVGDVRLDFLAKYANIGIAATGIDPDEPGGFENEGADTDLMAGVAAASGSFGAIGFEAEFMVLDYSFDGKDIDLGPAVPNDLEVPEDYTVWGLYGNVWMTMDAVKLGGYAAYASTDDDSGQSFDMGADFYFGAQGVGDNQSVGGFSYNDFIDDGSLTNNKGAFKGVTLIGVYADYSVNDALSFYGNFSYWMSNEKDVYNTDPTDDVDDDNGVYGDKGDSPWKDATGYELTVTAAYKLADNVTYSAGGAYGQFDIDDSDIADPDAYMGLFHKIQINF